MFNLNWSSYSVDEAWSVQHVRNENCAVNAVCSLHNQLKACVSERCFCPAESFSTNLLCLSHTHTTILPPIYAEFLCRHAYFFSLSLFLSLTHTHTLADIHHTGSGRKWGTCEQSGMTHCSPCTCPLAAAPTHNNSQQEKATCWESSYLLFILAFFLFNCSLYSVLAL